MSRCAVWAVLLFVGAAQVWGQTGTAPVLTAKPEANYPAQARLEQVRGDAVVAFSIDGTGKTTRVHVVSGPESLAYPLQNEIREWRFVTPLPRDGERDFVAVYTYSIVTPDEQVDASGNHTKGAIERRGPFEIVPGPIFAVSGLVHSLNNRQVIDATPPVSGSNEAAAESSSAPH